MCGILRKHVTISPCKKVLSQESSGGTDVYEDKTPLPIKIMLSK